MQDTIELLKECDAGAQMGTDAIEEVLTHIDDPKLEQILKEACDKHSELSEEIHNLLNDLGESGKEPNTMAKGMSWLKTNFKLTTDESDNTVADLITDGCDMGVKSLRRYLNQYSAADKNAKELAGKLIQVEENLRADMVKYL